MKAKTGTDKAVEALLEQERRFCERKVSQARRKAFEEAAQKTETFFDWCGPIGEHANMAMAQGFAKECAAAIRALMEQDRGKED